MKLKVIRRDKSSISLIGDFYIDDVFFCYSLEDVDRKEKIQGQTSIPCGIYEVIITYSQRFKKELPLLLNVPNFEGVRIHSGNRAEDTEGCILVGLTKDKDFIGNSRYTLSLLMEKLEKAYENKEEITLEIINEF